MSGHKRIAVLCNYELLPDRVGGMDYFYWAFNERMLELGVDIDWYFPNTSDHGSYDRFNIIPAGSPSVESRFLDELNRSQKTYDLVVCHFHELCTAFFKKVKTMHKGPIVGVEHNPRPLEGYSLKKRLKKRIKGLIYSRYIDVFVGVSNSTVQELLEDYGPQIRHKSRTIYNGVIIDNIPVRKHRSLSNPNFIVVSHLRQSKGIQDLIEAVNRLDPAIKNELSIDVYGDGPYRNVLESMVDEYNLKSVFHFHGSSGRVKELYCNYDYMLQPTHMECFSLSILESLAANVPVITTNVGGNEEAVLSGKNGFIFQAGNITALKSILEKLYSGELQINGNTRTRIEENFSIDNMVSGHVKLVQELLNSNSGRS